MIIGSVVYLGCSLAGAYQDGAIGTMRGAAVAAWITLLVLWWQLRAALRSPARYQPRDRSWTGAAGAGRHRKPVRLAPADGGARAARSRAPIRGRRSVTAGVPRKSGRVLLAGCQPAASPPPRLVIPQARSRHMTMSTPSRNSTPRWLNLATSTLSAPVSGARRGAAFR